MHGAVSHAMDKVEASATYTWPQFHGRPLKWLLQAQRAAYEARKREDLRMRELYDAAVDALENETEHSKELRWERIPWWPHRLFDRVLWQA